MVCQLKQIITYAYLNKNNLTSLRYETNGTRSKPTQSNSRTAYLLRVRGNSDSEK